MASKHKLEDATNLDRVVSNWAEFQVAELKAAITARGLTKSGKKANLVARLEAYDREHQQAAAQHAHEDEGGNLVDWYDLKVVDLQAELERRGLPKSGRKADLVARLEALDNLDNHDRSMAGPSTNPASASPSKPKSKRAKKEPSPDVVIDGPLASQLVAYQAYDPNTGETRLRPFVPVPDDTYKKKLKRIQKERMFMLDRTKSTDNEGHPREKFTIAGSTGNLYNTTISRRPGCDCMDA
ncbi:SWIM zinc finger protein [Phlyctema vagabunda]|uniref:SWIM zinc finger protein n=1 Tax=Phlyctema vagabunda TaxID=108571 RepID=A0ABR4PTF2_9HELO